jgi:hypothetical protein
MADPVAPPYKFENGTPYVPPPAKPGEPRSFLTAALMVRRKARRACHSPTAISVIHRGAQRRKLELVPSPGLGFLP